MAIINYNFESKYLNQNEEVIIIMPDMPREKDPAEFFGSGEKYKVLFLLHGTYGDCTDWIRRTKIELYATEKNLVVVIPNAMNSDYMNWPGFGLGYNMYDFVLKELMPIIHNWFPVSSEREDNYIAGLSMGGEGAAIIGLFNPDKFGAIGSLSFPVIDYEKHPDAMAGLDKTRNENMIANMGGWDEFIKSKYNIWDRLFNSLSPEDTPKLFFSCGTKEFFWEYYCEMKNEAQKRGRNDIIFKEYEGYGHEWRVWDLAIADFIDFADDTPKNNGNMY